MPQKHESERRKEERREERRAEKDTKKERNESIKKIEEIRRRNS